jgi:hypothetical protein
VTVYSKRAIALPNPNSTDPAGKDKEILLGHEKFTHDVPEGLKDHPYFKANVADGNLIVVETSKDVEKVVEGSAPKRPNAQKETKPEDLGVVDGGDAK